MKEDFQNRICANPAYELSDKMVAVALCWFINRRTRTSWPSYERLAKVTGLHRDTVRACIKKMDALGDIRVVRRRRED